MIRNERPEFVKAPSSASLEDIARDYNEAFKNGFDLSTEEIATYLGVTDRWIARHLHEGIKYLYINSVARRALATYGDKNFKHLYTYKKKIFHRKAWQTHLLQHSFIEADDGSLLPIEKLPKELISCTEAAAKYNITRPTFYKYTKGKATKYVVYELKRYSSREIELLLLDL
ncbi:hypothetical protein [Listeria booriae]|uniref:Uncharacterized protein n=1 Tax=Listeria booriae TaxID=1552123 RepID=A0A7X1A9L9_9LIST|nr:hypothetical protein [Listeria booriae]MBC1212470.1 hypothetical protein [Listeria booriae]MBC1309345.1 hypothetical protein [Listeria booriae]MBC2373728.1 hypothetical protein [Listeria booriae]